MALSIVLGMLAGLSLLLTLWQWVGAIRFPLQTAEQAPSGEHRALANAATGATAITLLKPLKGFDARTRECLESWLAQSYGGEVEILFGVASADDPVCKLVVELMRAYPKANARLVICPEDLGANAKVSTLIQCMRLCHHDVIIVSDADVWVPANFLTNLMPFFSDPAVGLVNCFYKITHEDEKRGESRCTKQNAFSKLTMRLEAFAVNADFWSQVLQSQSLKPLDFALGAVMATTRGHLSDIGAFEALADYLADDYQLGRQIAGTGARVVLCPMVVECRHASTTWREVWRHQLRWARTIRICQPVAYFFSQLQNATFWPALFYLRRPNFPVGLLLVLCLLVRGSMAFYCARKLTRRADWRTFCLAPVKDLFQTLLWASAFLGNHIEWRGKRFEVCSGGKLIKSC